jgi:predicted NAD/FAD-binding protein
VKELLVASRGRRLVRLAAAVKDRAVVGALIRTSAASAIVFAVGGRIVPRRRATWASWRHSFAVLSVGKVRQT